MEEFKYADPKKIGNKSKDTFISTQYNETGSFDQGICPYCYAYIVNIDNLINYDLSNLPSTIYCPSCNNPIIVNVSVQYLCSKENE